MVLKLSNYIFDF